MNLKRGSEGGPPPDDAADAEPGQKASETAKADTDGSDDWNSIFRRYQTRYDNAKSNINWYESGLKRCKQGDAQEREAAKKRAIERGESWLQNEKNQTSPSCGYYTRGIEQKKSEMKQIENECANDARKRRILPGKARLRK